MKKKVRRNPSRTGKSTARRSRQTLLVRFRVLLSQSTGYPHSRNHGPLFHRWLPDGERDAVTLATKAGNVTLKVWFDRSGFVDDSFIVYDSKRKEIDTTIMQRQGKLDAGPLKGLLEMRGLRILELACLTRDLKNSSTYSAVGKRLVKLICPPVSSFVMMLRANYGQHWLQELRRWDSRTESIGAYCSYLSLKWSLDAGKTWRYFQPEKVTTTTITLPRENFSEYLTKKDWQAISESASEAYQPSLAAIILSRSNEHLDEGGYRYALIDGVTALDVAIDHFMQTRLGGKSAFKKSLQAFRNARLELRLVAVAATLGSISHGDMEETMEVIKMRNKVVHDAWEPPEREMTKLHGLFRTTAALLPGPGFKFPIYYPMGNVLYPPGSTPATTLVASRLSVSGT